MTDQLPEKEALRRARISEARKVQSGVSGDRGVAARAAKTIEAQRFAAFIQVRIAHIQKHADHPLTYQAICDKLNADGVKARRGGAWSPKQIERLCKSMPD